MGDLMPNGLLPNEVDGTIRVLDLERWAMAEERTAELICCIQPNQPSEERRNAVANYVQQLVAKCISCEVFTFGSVPLKTYLPDGDIDLTAFSDNENLKDTWANEVRDALENEGRSEQAEFQVKEVQYIQAEVKIIKCLVENIVVDISFNQVGGLCTLCFLEEIDHLIGRNHLFKRSIILIKAWCYYESRILGAHHGLISTYALETLVLYIFHVFNNSFAGPLEVLYRFLEFFSNFDWDNFCVSLWGPVPISSLPEMIAEPPRKDRGELLLDKPFLDACTAIYGVLSGNQENHGLPFVSKYFNVIDPLRINNNLGRSVSKGNFFRIRSAFTFGAKKLAKLLECPKENLIAELSQFFMNTWERHGSGLRPDAPCSSIKKLRSLEKVPVEESKSCKSAANNKQKSANECHAANSLAFQGSIPQVMNIITQHTQNVHKMSNSSVVSHTQNQKNYGNFIGSRDSDQLERSTSSSGVVEPDRSQKFLNPDHSVNDGEANDKFHFARTRSSPELTETSVEKLSHVLRSTVLNSHARLDYGSRRKNLAVEVSSSPRSFLDNPSTLRHNTLHQSLEASTDTNSVSTSYHEDAGYSTMGEELPSVSEALELRQDMQQEEQDLVNMMASRLHDINGQVQLPMHLASPHLPIPFSPVLASVGYNQIDLTRIIPNNITFIDPSWGSAMQLPQGFVPSHPSPYFPAAESLSTNPEDMVESGYQPEDSDHGICHEHNSGSSREFDSDNGGVQVLHSDDRQHLTMGGFKNSTPLSRGFSTSTSLTQGQQKVIEHRGQARDNHAREFDSDKGGVQVLHSDDRPHLTMGGFNNSIPLSRGCSTSTSLTQGQQKAIEHRGQVRDNHAISFPYQASRGGNDINSNDRNPNSRSLRMSHAGSLQSKSSSESSRDGSSARVAKSARDKWGSKPASSAVVNNTYGRVKSGWQFESSSGRVSPHEDEDGGNWVPLSTMGTDMVDRYPGSVSRSHQSPGYEPAHQANGSDPIVPVAPVIVGNSRQMTDNSGVAPVAFYPTGPPVPFLAMLPFPVYKFRSNSSNLDVSSSHFGKDDGVDDSCFSASDINFDSEVHKGLATLETTVPETSEEPKSDILHSDFASHWQNLQYGRLCQTNQNNGVFINPSPLIVSPAYLQGHFPLEGPGRPVSTNLNIFPQMMSYGSRLVPVVPLQQGTNRPSGVFQRYGNVAPRFRGGTGTYLPSPVSYRDRQFPSTRNQRGNHNYDWNDHSDREGSWISTKNQAAGRSHGRSHAEKPRTRLDRFGVADKRSHLSQNNYFGASNSSQGLGNIPYGMYNMHSVSSNGVGSNGPAVPSPVLFYPYDQGVVHISSSEPVESSSLGSVQLSGTNDALRPKGGNVERVHEQRQGTYRGTLLRSSPDQPSSPRIQRSTTPRNYQLKDEDFPPLSFANEGDNVASNYDNRPH